MIEHYNQNNDGRDFVVGDIHGCFTKLQQALDKLNFDPAKDRLFSVGDLVDRGPESDQVVDWLAKPWFHAVRGNHDQFIVDFMMGPMDKQMYALNGGKWFLNLKPEERYYYFDAVKNLPILIEVETKHGLVGIVHADIYGNDWNDFKEIVRTNPVNHGYVSYAMWARDRLNFILQRRIKMLPEVSTPIHGLYRMYVGHNVVKQVTDIDNIRYIDLGMGFKDGPQEFYIEQFN